MLFIDVFLAYWPTTKPHDQLLQFFISSWVQYILTGHLRPPQIYILNLYNLYTSNCVATISSNRLVFIAICSLLMMVGLISKNDKTQPGAVGEPDLMFSGQQPFPLCWKSKGVGYRLSMKLKKML